MPPTLSGFRERPSITPSSVSRSIQPRCGPDRRGRASDVMELVDPFKLVGRIVDGRYRIERVAGRGGYGVVYRAFHLSFESPIALKVLKLADELPADKAGAQIAAFQREGKVLFELSSLHRSIVKAFETGVVALFDGSVAPYLALEWLDGVSLDRESKHRRKQGLPPMTLDEVCTLLDEPAKGLALPD